MWKVYNYSKRGSRNESRGLSCQDCVSQLITNDYQAIALADGTGNDDYAKIGAEKSCSTLTQLLTECFDELYDMENDLVRFNVVTNIQSELYDLCEKHGIEMERLNSTLLGVAIDNAGERFIAVHLGDGSIKCRKNGKFVTLSHPENGVNGSYTYLTSERYIGKYIRIYKGELDNIDRFVLYSDGWNETKNEMNENYDCSQLFADCEENTYLDDISFISLNKD